MEPVTFRTARQFRTWLGKHGSTEKELTVRILKKKAGGTYLSYAEALDEALCHGWIDGVRRSVDEGSYTIRFSPRKKGSLWSNVNVRHVERLREDGRMTEAGLREFDRRDQTKTGVYSFENPLRRLPTTFVAMFRKAPEAWSWWNEQPFGYRRKLSAWIVTAKRPETRERRFLQLLSACREHRRLFS